MIRFVLARLLQSLVALAILSVVVFILARATGDPLHLILPMSATKEDYDEARRYLGLDRPYVVQYLSFVGRAVTTAAPPRESAFEPIYRDLLVNYESARGFRRAIGGAASATTARARVIFSSRTPVIGSMSSTWTGCASMRLMPCRMTARDIFWRS